MRLERRSRQGGTTSGGRWRAAVASALLAGTVLVPGVGAQDGATGSDVCTPFHQGSEPVPASDPADPYACRLPAWDPASAWPFAGTVDAANAFHWALEAGDAVDPQGDLVGVGWAPVTLSKAEASKLVKSRAFLTLGEPGKAIRAGRYVLVQLETAEAPAMSAARNLSFHVGTDRKGDPGNNVPASVAAPESPYQDLQDVYTVYLAATAAAPGAYTTDFAAPALANGSVWYNGKAPFAARLTDDPAGIQFLVPAKGMGDSFRPIAFSDAEAEGSTGRIASVGAGDVPLPRTFDQGSDVPAIPTGSDFGAIGTRLGLFPRDGVANAMVGCLEADTIHVGVTVDALAIDDVTQPFPTLPSQTPVIWCTWPTFADGDTLAQWFNFADADGDGVTLVTGTITVREAIWDPQANRSRSRELRQTMKLRVTLRGGNLYIGATVGLGSYGYHDLQSIELESTLNEEADRILQRSADAAVAVLPAWSVDETEGWTAGDATCLPDDVREPLGLQPR